MKKSTISDIGKKRIGRPPVGSAPTMVRLLLDQAATLDA
jgi:hypothetical protein